MKKPLTPPPSGIGSRTPSGLIISDFKYDDPGAVNAWMDAVSVAGALEPVEQVIVWPVKERARKPYPGDWHEWRVNWKTSPPDYSRFSSNDWAVDTNMFYLTMPPREVKTW